MCGPESCPDCGGQMIFVGEKPWCFKYGEESVELTANIPLWECKDCGFAWTDGRGAMLEHEAVCRHLGVLTPHEVRELRERHELTQRELAQLTGFGVRSIKRWERGTLVQNASADRFLRLIDDAEVMNKLRKLAEQN